MKRIDRNKMGEELSAYLDGELDDESRAAVEELLERDPAARTELERLRQTAAMLSSLPRRAAPATLIGDVMPRAGRDESGRESAAKRHAFRGVRVSMLLGMAAVVAAAVGVGLWSLTERGLDRGSYEVVSAQKSAEPGVAALHHQEQFSAPPSQAPDEDEFAAERQPFPGPPAPEGSASNEEPLPHGRGSVRNEEPLPDRRGSVVDEEPLPHGRGSVWEKRTAAPLTEPAAMIASGMDAREKADQKAPMALYIQVTYHDEADFELATLLLNQFGAPETDQAGGGMNAYGAVRVADRIVRLSPSELARLTAFLAAGPIERREIAMSVDELVEVRGWPEAERLVAMIALAEEHDSSIEGEESRGRRMAKGRAEEMGDSLRTQVADAPPGGAGSDPAKMSAADLAMQKAQAPKPARSAGAGRSESSAAMRDQVAASFESQPSGTVDDDLITVHVRLLVPITSPPPGEPGQLAPRDTKDP